MTDLAAAEPLSTTLDPNEATSPSGAGAPRALSDEPKEPSLRDIVAEESKKDAEPKEDAKPDADKDDDKAASAKGEEKGAAKPQEADKADTAKDAPKAPERAPDGKFAGKQAEGEPDAKPDQKSGHFEAPRNFLPDAKETWRNTPRAVQRDVADTIQRHEAEVARYRETAERYEPIREFDELARANGREGLRETLAEVKQLEDLMERNPIAAVNQILLRAGPRKADGQPVSLFELAQHIVNSGQDNYQRAVTMPAPQQQQQREDPRVAELEKQLAQIQHQTLTATIIEPFKTAHPRYEELRDDIAFFLQSGKIPSSLSPSDRLAAAYDMAARINPASHANDAAAIEMSPEPRDRAAPDLSGGKSIKSAPGAVSADMEPDRGGSIRDLLASEMKRAKGSR